MSSSKVHEGAAAARVATAALAARESGVFHLTHLRSPESAEVGALEDVIGLIPLGAVEQHGPHLPLATDAIIAEHLATEVAGRLPRPVVVAPVLSGGMSWHHLHFPGTVHLGKEVFSGFVRAYVDTMTKLGIRDILMFSAHGGNFALMGEIAAGYADSAVRVVAYTDLRRYLEVMTKGAAEAGLNVPATDAHAGGLETSQMMFLLGEDLVQVPDDLEGCYAVPEPGWLDRLLNEGVHALSPIGVIGQPAGATAEAGRAIFAALVDELLDWALRSVAVTT
jgi:creatinine amidohydrolase